MAVSSAPAAAAPRTYQASWSTRASAFVKQRGLLSLGIAFILAYTLFPFYWMVASSLKGQATIQNNSLVPTHPTFENYKAVFQQQKFIYPLRNSVIIAGTATVVALIVGVFASYALARLRFKGKFLVLGAVLSIAMFPPIALLTPIFELFTRLGWIDQYQSMIIPYVSFTLPLTIWILTSFFAQMPWELEQAAKVDGATPGQAFRRVIIPLAAPGVFTTAILVFIYAWNEFMIALAVTQTYASKPVTVAIATFTGASGSAFQIPYGTIMAAGVIVTIPLVVMVLLFQRRIVAGLTAGGVKG